MITAVLLTVTLLLVGVALLAIEVVLVPGVGLVGFFGLAGIGAAVWIAYAMIGPAYAGLALTGGVVACGLAFWLLPRTRLARSMVLEGSAGGRAGDPSLMALAGKVGTTVTALRPSGTVDFAGRPVDVVSDGDYIDRGVAVRVILVQGSRVVVERADDA